MVWDGLLLGVCDYSPFEEARLILGPVLLYIAFPSLWLAANFLIYFIGFLITNYQKVLKTANTVMGWDTSLVINLAMSCENIIVLIIFIIDIFVQVVSLQV